MANKLQTLAELDRVYVVNTFHRNISVYHLLKKTDKQITYIASADRPDHVEKMNIDSQEKKVFFGYNEAAGYLRQYLAEKIARLAEEISQCSWTMKLLRLFQWN